MEHLENYSIYDNRDCKNKLCIIVCDALDLEFQDEVKKIIIHGIMYNHYLSESYKLIIRALEESKYSISGFIESDFKSNCKHYNQLYKVNIGDYCIIKDSYKDERYGIFDKIIVFLNNGIGMKQGWIRRENLLFIEKIEKDTILEKCCCDD